MRLLALALVVTCHRHGPTPAELRRTVIGPPEGREWHPGHGWVTPAMLERQQQGQAAVDQRLLEQGLAEVKRTRELAAWRIQWNLEREREARQHAEWLSEFCANITLRGHFGRRPIPRACAEPPHLYWSSPPLSLRRR